MHATGLAAVAALTGTLSALVVRGCGLVGSCRRGVGALRGPTRRGGRGQARNGAERRTGGAVVVRFGHGARFVFTHGQIYSLDAALYPFGRTGHISHDPEQTI